MIKCVVSALPDPSFFSLIFLFYAIATLSRLNSQRQSFVRCTVIIRRCVSRYTCRQELKTAEELCMPYADVCPPGTSDQWIQFKKVLSAYDARTPTKNSIQLSSQVAGHTLCGTTKIVMDVRVGSS
ncbi:hypothetical protein EVAR_36326_1 [Eumeta japonica]|uniref:Uncharacterized protein n=1 Tax=Eumeta variegata TaxID=151549 RepID=A0A4C1VI85_EUMVA|nr:hypothetical protein EVAR_36326_1 [Eumeta japonica]